MKFQTKLIKGIIHNRYKRFLSDIELEDGQMVNAHVPNTGSMKTCWGEKWPVWLTPNDNPKRKLKYTLEMTDNGKSLICVNTSLTNKLVKEALENGMISEFQEYKTIQSEKKIFNSRLDFFLTDGDRKDAYIEVKNVTLDGGDGLALFPDSVTTRGQKHLRDLIKIKKTGLRACMLYVVNREDVNRFSPAKDIDPAYAALVTEAKAAGVEILVYGCSLSPKEIIISRKLELQDS